MIKIINEYKNIIGYTVTGLIFGLAFFIVLLNAYHYQEVNKTFIKTEKDLTFTDELTTNINQINKNIEWFNLNTYNGSFDQYEMSEIKSKISICTNSFNNKESNDLLNKKEVDLLDVYNLNQRYQQNVINECLVRQMYDMSIKEEMSDILGDNQKFIQTLVEENIEGTEYLQSTLKNNSSYHFNSDYAMINILNQTKDSYYYIIGNYRSSINLVLVVSEWYKTLEGV